MSMSAAVLADLVGGNATAARLIGIFKPDSPVSKTVTVHYLVLYMANGKCGLLLEWYALEADQ